MRLRIVNINHSIGHIIREINVLFKIDSHGCISLLANTGATGASTKTPSTCSKLCRGCVCFVLLKFNRLLVDDKHLLVFSGWIIWFLVEYCLNTILNSCFWLIVMIFLLPHHWCWHLGWKCKWKWNDIVTRWKWIWKLKTCRFIIDYHVIFWNLNSLRTFAIALSRPIAEFFLTFNSNF